MWQSPIPMPFFHLMTIMTHAYLLLLEWNAAPQLAVRLRESARDAERGRVLRAADPRTVFKQPFQQHPKQQPQQYSQQY